MIENPLSDIQELSYSHDGGHGLVTQPQRQRALYRRTIARPGKGQDAHASAPRAGRLGIPALESAPQAPHIWVYPPTKQAYGISVNPVYPPAYKDFILVFPVG